jgi:molybdenum cofactor cytidylyltransferase
MPVAAVILAAGASRRLGRPKQLLRLNGGTLLARAVRIAGESGASPVITVLGAHFAEVSAAIPQGDSIHVLNEDWEQGIASSIHAGLRALDAVAPQSPGVLLMTCDQPRLTSRHPRALLESFLEQSDPTIIASAYAATVGVPAVFPRAAFPMLLELHGDQGARKLLLNPPCPLIQIDFPGGEIDIDEPADLTRLE